MPLSALLLRGLLWLVICACIGQGLGMPSYNFINAGTTHRHPQCLLPLLLLMSLRSLLLLLLVFDIHARQGTCDRRVRRHKRSLCFHRGIVSVRARITVAWLGFGVWGSVKISVCVAVHGVNDAVARTTIWIIRLNFLLVCFPQDLSYARERLQSCSGSGRL